MSNETQIPGLVLVDHHFTVPLDYAKPDGATIEVYAREVRSLAKSALELPWIVYMQGGPGFESPRPASKSGWLKRAVEEYRVLLLDQRGTGRSTPINYQTMARFESAQEQADYLKHFRADSIVRDAETIRRELAGGDEKWSVLGQSYGGFCITTYLSIAPEGLKEAIFTGGLPPLGGTADDVYRATFKRVIDKNELYYQRYPDDVEKVHKIIAYLQNHEVALPSGGMLTARRFRQLGIRLGGQGGFESLHFLIENAFVDTPDGEVLNFTFLHAVDNAQGFETNPIYAILHEAIYCQGTASNWSAERIQSEYPQFEITPDKPIFFTGEMVYSWMFDDYMYLRPLKEAANLLATYDGWSDLYDADVLAKNDVPCVAAVYYDDMYVERIFSDQTAKQIRGLRYWVTSEYEHSGLRDDPSRIFGRLLDMLHGEI